MLHAPTSMPPPNDGSFKGALLKRYRPKYVQLCPTLCDPMDYNPPGSSVHGILQARILKWVAIQLSRGSS